MTIDNRQGIGCFEIWSFFEQKLLGSVATWQSGDAAACKAVYSGSIPLVASTLNKINPHPCPGGGIGRRKGLKIPRLYKACRFDSGPGHHKINTLHAVCIAFDVSPFGIG